MRRRLLGNAFALISVQIINYISPFVVLIHLTKTLGLEIYGVLAFVQAIIGISVILLDFGYAFSATNKISKNRNRKKYVSSIIGGIYIIKFFIFVLCIFSIMTYSVLTIKYNEQKIVFLLALIPIVLYGFMPTWFFQGIEKMQFFALINILGKFIFTFSIIYFVKSPSDYFLVPVLNGLGMFFPLVISIYLIYRGGYKIKFPSIKIVAYCYKFTLQYFVSRIAVASYMNGAIVVLGLIAQPAIVAVYSMAEQLYKVMQSALSPIASAIYPYMTKEKDFNLMLKVTLGVLSFTVIGSCTGFFFAPILVETVFDQTWLASIPVLNVFFVAIIVHAAAVMSGYPLAAIINKYNIANNSEITGALIYFVTMGLILFFNLVTPTYLALAMLMSELSVFFHRFLVLVPLAIKRYKIISR